MIKQNFSERNGYTSKQIQFENVDSALRNRIWNIFLFENQYLLNPSTRSSSLEIIEEILDIFGLTYEYPKDWYARGNNMKKLESLFSKKEWHFVYDFIEVYLEKESEKSKSNANNLAREFIRVLEEEKSGYRIVKRLVVPITNKSELRSIEQSTNTKYDSVNTHMSKALSLYSRRKNPDYENSIKESISAIESLCCIITDNNKATLGDALKKMDERGLKLHGALKSALTQLYGYTSDQNGIRHAGIDFAGASTEDAKYMLVSCSGFVNYIVEKWEKNNNQ
ncbi:hypothetical protein SAMN05661091_3434 [Paenibacillus uliginis N3/975]|uniref:HEPN AbiJ-N-terminal domain-containing protein n=1 Tax=Paenibacillus uliginis N3/975 TaxID=1313296 RepID=A0A1X7HH10_9BACL|nr:hypothetical protein [Paenibacillus uliginis]SMF86583.1 hypothetical protein SAMN05661091_3434 [Paenibacillus uliginis N3/975]